MQGKHRRYCRKRRPGREGELARIADGIRTFEGINKVQAGLTAGNLPAGHSIGASFSQRSQPKQRQRNMKQYGGSAQTESAVDRALRFLAGAQNRDGSWGSRESFASGDSGCALFAGPACFFGAWRKFSLDASRKMCAQGN